MRRFFGTSASTKEPSAQKGERIYAIGDIHGRLDLLRALLAEIERHAEARPRVKSTHVILLGDMVDRGPDPAGVLRFVHKVHTRTTGLITLMGNHEDLMLRALDGESGLLHAWVRSGGAHTLKSLGFDPPTKDTDKAAYIAAVNAAIPREWIEWMRRLPLSATSGDYFFCHAGVRPGVTLARQNRTDLLWIREDFLEDPRDHGAVIVHGHSIAREVDMRGNRIGIDTGAYRNGTLTALYLEGSAREILSVAG